MGGVINKSLPNIYSDGDDGGEFSGHVPTTFDLPFINTQPFRHLLRQL